MKKIEICLNVLLHYKKYRKFVGSFVKITKNDGRKIYDKYINEKGWIVGFEFENFEKTLIIRFNDGNKYCFSFKEINLIK